LTFQNCHKLKTGKLNFKTLKMKKIHIILCLGVLGLLSSCTKDNDDLSFLETATAPKNISALVTTSQDNTGTVTFLPKGEGVTHYEIYFGDGTAAPAIVKAGETVSHVYTEGVYQAKIIGMTLNGKKAEVTQEVVVSFKAPENLVVTIENDAAVSKKVTVKTTADNAISYDVYFGEAGKTDPVSGSIGTNVSYTYQAAGNYTIKVVAKSASSKTLEYTKIFTVTLVNKPSTAAPTPPNRQATDVISIYSAKYTTVAGTNYFPDWGQAGNGSSWAEFDLNGDKMLNYINLSYQGIELASGTTIDVSAMEFIHMDVWTSDAQKINTFLISKTKGEKAVIKDLTAGSWTSLDIPISAFTSQGMTVADIFQLKFEGTPSAKGTVFIDNIYL
jgi:hypothetical protein